MKDLERVHKFTMIAKYRHGIGGALDSLQNIIDLGDDPNAHMSIKVGTEYYQAVAVLKSLDDLHIKGILDSFSSTDTMLLIIYEDSGVLEAYRDFKSNKD